MKQLTLIRHSKTEVVYEGISDFERQLKPRGRKDAQLIANELKSNGIAPDMIVSSNAIRAFQTAVEMAKVMKFPLDDIVKEPFIYDGYTTGEFLTYISKLDDKIKSVWVVGHNPEIALLCMNLTSENFFHFPTSSSVVVNFNADKWSEVAAREGVKVCYLTPRVLKEK